MSTLNIEINGTIDTNLDVLTNINRIADASLCFVSWDLAIGKWSVILKELEAPSRAFNDSNIVGSINIGGSGLRETYNSATIRFPHKDLDSESDYVTVEVDASERYPNELDNELQLSTGLVNDPVHAQYMASLELKNSRLDQIITFSTDFSELGVTAGDVITVTNSIYGFTNKQFRVQRVSERDNTDGTLLIDIIAQEYKDIFNSALSRTDINREGGITPYEACETLQEADKEAVTSGIDPLSPNVLDTIFGTCFRPLTIKYDFKITGPSMACENQTVELLIEQVSNLGYPYLKSLNYEITGNIEPDDIGIPFTGTINLNTSTNSATISIPITTAGGTEGDEFFDFRIFDDCISETHKVTIHDNYKDSPIYTVTPDKSSPTECQTLTFTICATNTDDDVEIPYTITGITQDDLDSGFLTGILKTDWCNSCATVTIDFKVDADVGTETVVFTLGNNLAVATVPLYDDYAYVATFSPQTIMEGEITTATITVTGGIPNGTVVPYTLGQGGRMITPPNGTITINNGTATLQVQTIDDLIDQGTPGTVSVQMTIGPAPGKHCTGGGFFFLQDNDEPSQALCLYVSVPMVWCGNYNAQNQLTSLTPRRNFNFLKSPAIGSPIQLPKTVTVTAGNPSTINVTEYETVYSDPSMGGIDVNIITSFNSIGSSAPITGTTTVLRGYDTTF